jgi:hypothetical protein
MLAWRKPRYSSVWRSRVKEGAEVPDSDLHHQRAVVDAFFLAARSGDFDALVALLHPTSSCELTSVRATWLRPRSSVAQRQSLGKRASVPVQLLCSILH